jgi:biopolymer transport protein ExbD
MLRRQRAGLPATKVEMPITPLLDVTFQLLFFLVLTFQPRSVVEGGMEFSLPAEPSGRDPFAGLLTAVDPAPDESAVQLTIIVKTIGDGLSKGGISALLLQTPQGVVSHASLEALQRDLQARGPDAKKTQVRIQADSRLKYACVMDIMDACVQSGFARVGFSAPPDLGGN